MGLTKRLLNIKIGMTINRVYKKGVWSLKNIVKCWKKRAHSKLRIVANGCF